MLLKNAQEGRVTESEALRVIKDCREKAARVEELLAQLGDDETTVALSKRFQSMRRKMETGRGAPEHVDVFGLLTMAMHELNVLLSERFYR
ncbi:MAG: hypothetical protein ACXWKH_01460 [Limisphaerales bacterium]